MNNDSSLRVPRRFLPSWHLWLALAFFVSLAVYALHRLVWDYWAGGYENDFMPYYEAARRFQQGGLLYVPDQGFVYPPPSVLMFLPLLAFTRHTAYVLFSAFSFLPLLLAVAFMGGLWHRSGRSTTLLEKTAVLSCVLAVAPSFENAAWGQVNTIVLLSCVMYFWLLATGRPVWAGLVLSIGAWIKVYPVFLIAYLFVEPRHWRAMVGIALGGVLVPLLGSLIVPLPLYWQYLFHVLPDFSQQAKPRVMNQSLVGLLIRMTLGPVNVSLNTRLPLCAWMNWANRLMFLLAFVMTLWAGLRFPRLRDVVVPACLLSLIPLFSPMGWSYVYVLALPLMSIALLVAGEMRVMMRIIMLTSIGAMTIPAHHILPGAAHLPWFVQHVVYTRYFFATILLGIVVVVHVIQQAEDEVHDRTRSKPLL